MGSMVTLRRECPLSSSAYRRSHLHTDRPHLHMLSGTLSTFQGVRPGPSYPSPSMPAEGGAPAPAACLGLGLSVSQRQPTLCGSSPTCGGWCLAFLSCSKEWSSSSHLLGPVKLLHREPPSSQEATRGGRGWPVTLPLPCTGPQHPER